MLIMYTSFVNNIWYYFYSLLRINVFSLAPYLAITSNSTHQLFPTDNQRQAAPPPRASTAPAVHSYTRTLVQSERWHLGTNSRWPTNRTNVVQNNNKLINTELIVKRSDIVRNDGSLQLIQTKSIFILLQD